MIFYFMYVESILYRLFNGFMMCFKIKIDSIFHLFLRGRIHNRSLHSFITPYSSLATKWNELRSLNKEKATTLTISLPFLPKYLPVTANLQYYTS